MASTTAGPAAPADKTINDLTGQWEMVRSPFPPSPLLPSPHLRARQLTVRDGQNKKLSDSPDPGLSLQGISWTTRKLIGYATVTLHVTHYHAAPSPPSTSTDPVTHIDINQVIVGGLKGTQEVRCLDGAKREHADWLFGRVEGQARWISLDEVDADDESLKKGWLAGEAAHPDGKTHIMTHGENLDDGGGWAATQVWGFQEVDGERRYARNIVIKKGSKSEAFRLVYDYKGPLPKKEDSEDA